MPMNRTGPRYFKMMERNALVLKMRREGFTYREIEDSTGMDDSNARRLVEKHLANIPKENADELRTWENEKLNELARDAQDQAFTFYPELDADGKPIYEPLCDENGVVILDENYQPIWRMRRNWNTANQGKALLLKVHEARVKMFGLAAPAKFENVNPAQLPEITFRIVDSDGDGRMAPHSMQTAPESNAAVVAAANDAAAAAAVGASCFSSSMVNGVEVVTLTIPEPSALKYHDSGNPPDPDLL